MNESKTIYLIDNDGGHAKTNSRRMAQGLLGAGYHECSYDEYQAQQNCALDLDNKAADAWWDRFETGYEGTKDQP